MLSFLGKKITSLIVICRKLQFYQERFCNKRKGKRKIAQETGKEVVGIIYSLGTVENRMCKILPVLESLLNQTLKAEKICVCITRISQKKLPKEIRELKDSGRIEIFEGKYAGSSEKLLPTLEKYPKAVIITVDDDVIYPKWHLERIYQTHLQHPQKIIAYQARWIIEDSLESGTMDYQSWIDSMESLISWKPSPRREGGRIFPLGVRGVLYPPQSLNSDFLFSLREKKSPCLKCSDSVFFMAAKINKTIIRLLKITPLELKFSFSFLKHSEFPEAIKEEDWAERKCEYWREALIESRKYE